MDDIGRFNALMDALAEHIETISDREILDDAVLQGVDVKAEANKIRRVLSDAALRAKNADEDDR